MANTGSTCPVCGLENAFSQPPFWDVCPRCNWEDDPDQLANPDSWGGANTLSLNQTIQEWRQNLAVRAWKWPVCLLPDSDREGATLGPADQVRQTLLDVWPELDLADPGWGVLRRDHLILEFDIGAAPIVKSLGVNVYGSGDPISLFRELCSRTNWRALDKLASERGQGNIYLDFGPQSLASWLDWYDFRTTQYNLLAASLERTGKRLIFTTLTEVRSTKPVAAFEDIRAYNTPPIV